ncbi:MAG: 1-acyl-sn-glycerol-3-phosphate acyltransferase [Chromatiales bacterium]|nr:1-acyl-sn-glycerol-3-phosphate acyltransferase [Chromatiales bacterium]
MDSVYPFLGAVVLFLLIWQLARLYRACKKANLVDWGHGWVNLIDGLNRLFCYRYHRLNVTRLRLPTSGPCIVASNHVSGVDAMMLIASARRPLRFLIAREEYERFGFTWLFKAAGCIPVDRQSKPEQALRAALRALKDGEVIALFPHGKIHLDSDPPRKIKKGVTRLSHLTGAPVIPARITGIRGEGYVIRGVIMRSRAQIEAYPALSPERLDDDQLTERLQQILDGKVPLESALAG